MYYDNIRKHRAKVSKFHWLDHNAILAYNGAPEEYEDIADYIPRNLTRKGAVIA